MDRAHIATPDQRPGGPLDPNLSRRVGLALQINLHPRQAALAERALPQSLAAWAPLVDRVVLTIDNRQDRGCRGEAYRAARKRLFLLLDAMRRAHPGLGIDGVVYAGHVRQKIAARFFGGSPAWPDHAHDGSPFYGVFFGLMRANARSVLHLAADAPWSGSEEAWLARARTRLAENGALVGIAPGAASAGGMLLDMDRLFALAPLAPVRPGLVARLDARLRGRQAMSLPALDVIDAARLRAGPAGTGPGREPSRPFPRGNAREKGGRLQPATLLERL